MFNLPVKQELNLSWSKAPVRTLYAAKPQSDPALPTTAESEKQLCSPALLAPDDADSKHGVAEPEVKPEQLLGSAAVLLHEAAVEEGEEREVVVRFPKLPPDELELLTDRVVRADAIATAARAPPADFGAQRCRVRF